MSTYKIKKSNTNYIKALAKYCKDVAILSIESTDGEFVRNVQKKDYTCKDLPTLMSTVQDDEFIIRCSEYYSADSVLPSFDRASVSQTVATASASDRSQSEVNYGILKALFAHDTFKGPKAYMSPEYSSDKLKEIQPQLTQTQAILLLDQIAKNYAVSSAMLVARQQTYLFEVEHNFYYITFGDRAEFNKIKFTFMFDLDDGFVVANPYYGSTEHEKYNFIVNELNGRFNQWKADGYAGDLIPAEEAGLIQSRETRQSFMPTNRMFGQYGSPAPQPSPAADRLEAVSAVVRSSFDVRR